MKLDQMLSLNHLEKEVQIGLFAHMCRYFPTEIVQFIFYASLHTRTPLTLGQPATPWK